MEEIIGLDKQNLARRDRRLILLVSAFAVLVACTQVGAIIAPSLVRRNPELLLALSSRLRHLLFAVPADVNPIAYSIIGFLRIAVAAWLCYAIGYWYGDRGFRWLEHQVGGEPPAMLRWMQRGASRAGGPLLMFMPGSNIVCALVGQRRMTIRWFAFWSSLGIAFRLAWVWVAARLFDTQLRHVLDWIEKYQWWLVAAIFLITIVQASRRAASPPASVGPDAEEVDHQLGGS